MAQAESFQISLWAPCAPKGVPTDGGADHLPPAGSPGLCVAPFLLETPRVAAARESIFIKVDAPGG